MPQLNPSIVVTLLIVVGLGFLCIRTLPERAAQPATHPSTAFATPERPCGDNIAPAHEYLAASQLPELRKLAEYETVCEGAPIERVMLFGSMPFTPQEGRQLGNDMAARLHEMAAQQVAPLVVFEPGQGSKLIDLAGFSRGQYDAALEGYYTALRTAGINDEQMGMWVLFPEANTPAWRTTDPTTFSKNVTRAATLQKRYFPSSKATILLNSQTYPNNDDEWAHGSFASLVPYVKDIPHGLLDSFGYQGFPWTSPANAPHGPTLMDAAWFLKAGLAADAARQLQVRDIWLNTGTFEKLYAGESGRQVNQSAQARAATLAGITQQAGELNRQGFNVAVSLFAADKSATAERTNWSYWSQGQAETSAGTDVFRQFVRGLKAQRMGLWLYDAPQS